MLNKTYANIIILVEAQGLAPLPTANLILVSQVSDLQVPLFKGDLGGSSYGTSECKLL